MSSEERRGRTSAENTVPNKNHCRHGLCESFAGLLGKYGDNTRALEEPAVLLLSGNFPEWFRALLPDRLFADPAVIPVILSSGGISGTEGQRVLFHDRNAESIQQRE